MIDTELIRLKASGRSTTALGIYLTTPFATVYILCIAAHLAKVSLSGEYLLFASSLLALVGAPLALFGWTILSGIRKVESELGEEPSLSEVRSWLNEGIEELRSQSLKRLGLHKSLLSEEFAPQPTISPVLWPIQGVEYGDLLWRESENELFSGVYQIVFTHFTDDLIGIHSCFYNFLRNTNIDDQTEEFYHKDIVSLSTREESSARSLPTGKRLVQSQELSISASNGQKVHLGNTNLRIESMANRVVDTPASNTEQVTSAIRTLIFNRKSEVSEDLEGFGDPGPWS